MGKYDQFIELRSGGPYGEAEYEDEIFKCAKCDAETYPEKGFDGEPDRHVCTHDCRMDHSDVLVGNSARYVRNYDRVAWKGDGVQERLSAMGVRVTVRSARIH